MNINEARLILGSCPPGEVPPDDPQVQLAIEVARRSPELWAWWHTVRAFDEAAADRLRAVQPPVDLKFTILAGQRSTSSGSGARARWFSPWQWALGLAALLLAVLGLSAFLSPRPLVPGGLTKSATGVSAPASLASLRTAAARFLTEDWAHDFDVTQASFPKIQEWAQQQPNSLQLDAPAGLVSSPTYGCKIFQWHGQRASLVCFLPKDGGAIIHVVSVERRALPAQLRPDEMQPVLAGEWNTTGWIAGERVYLALSQRTTADLVRLAPSMAM